MISAVDKAPQLIAGYRPHAGSDDYWYDEITAQKPVSFAPWCQHIKGPLAGKPFHLQQWQEDITRTIFGWKRKSDQTRRYRTVFIMVPRKNGKSTWIANIANYVLFCDAEGGAECYCAASDREQASLVFNLSASMVRKQNKLDSICKIRPSQKRIIYDESFLRAIPANEGGSHGFNSHLIVGDELHAWPNRDFYEVLHTSTGARSQPLEVYITTAGHDRHSVCYEMYRYACQVRDGQIDDPTFLPVIYEALPEDDWTSPDTWAKANPNLGISVSREYIETECKKAQANPAYENAFRRLHLNQWTEQDVRWLQMDHWRNCPTGEPIEDGADVYGGLDLSSTRDITAWAIVQQNGAGWKCKMHYFIPAATLKSAEKRDGVPYGAWVKEGYVTATPGRSIDYDAVHEHIVADLQRHNFGCIGYDPWNANPTRTLLEDKGARLLKITQGLSGLSAPSKELERCVVERELQHNGDPVLEWMAGNVQVRHSDGNIRPVKPDYHSSSKRIDGIVALIMAIGTAQIIAEGSIQYQSGDLML